MYLPGIDVSHYQGTINWTAVANDTCNIKFAFVKATEGTTFTDPQFEANYVGLKSVGIKRGAYHFFYPKDSVEDQVQHFLNVVGDIQSDDLPPVLDVESQDDMKPESITRSVHQWLNQVQTKLSCTPIIYTSANFWNSHLASNNMLNVFPLKNGQVCLLINK